MLQEHVQPCRRGTGLPRRVARILHRSVPARRRGSLLLAAHGRRRTAVGSPRAQLRAMDRRVQDVGAGGGARDPALATGARSYPSFTVPGRDACRRAWRLVALGELKPAAARALPEAALRNNGRAEADDVVAPARFSQPSIRASSRQGAWPGCWTSRSKGSRNCSRRTASNGRWKYKRHGTPTPAPYWSIPTSSWSLTGSPMVLRATRTGLVIATMALNTTRRARSWLSWEGATRCHRRADSIGRRVRRLCDSAVGGL